MKPSSSFRPTLLAVASIFALLGATEARAVTNFCDCGDGSDAAPGCVPGNDSNSGATTLAGSTGPKRTRGAFETMANAAAGGAQFSFCKGGQWDSWSGVLLNGGLHSPRIIIDTFSPTQFSSTARPILNLVPGGTIGFDFSTPTGFSTAQHGGILLDGFEIRGTAGTDGQQGWRMYRQAKNIEIRNMKVINVDSYFNCGGLNNFPYPEYINMHHNDFSYSYGNTGVFGCSFTTVAYSTFDHSAYKSRSGKLFDHPLYFSGLDETNSLTGKTYSQGLLIRGNRITNSCYGSTDNDPTKCDCAIITGHDQFQSMIIDQNEIYQAPGTANAGCWGIAIEPANPALEFQRDLTISNNRVGNVGNVGITIMGTQGGRVFNNSVWWEQSTDGTGIRVRNATAPDQPNSNIWVYNNGVYFEGTNSSEAVAYQWSSQGSNHKFFGNVAAFGSGGRTGGLYCFDPNGATSTTIPTWDYNHCSNFTAWSPAWSSRASFTTGFGNLSDANSGEGSAAIVQIPSVANRGSLQAQTGSPWINSGHPTLSPDKAIDGISALGQRDKGPFEFGRNSNP